MEVHHVKQLLGAIDVLLLAGYLILTRLGGFVTMAQYFFVLDYANSIAGTVVVPISHCI